MSLADAENNTHYRRRPERARPLNRELGRWQIFMIAISTIIGIGFITRAGEILAFGGPATVLLSFAFVGLVAISVMEGISEMVITWPIANPMVEFVRRFVDRDFAVVVCVAYWYTWAMTFAALISTAGGIVRYWNDEPAAETLVYVLCPLLVFFINFNTVKLFGYLELFGGVLKVLVVFVIFVIMIALKAGAGCPGRKAAHDYIGDGFQSRPEVADNKAITVLIGINLAVYPFVGVESVTMTAFEAKHTRELKLPARNISYIVLSVYMISIVSMLLNVQWENPLLMAYYDQWVRGGDGSNQHCPAAKSALVRPRTENDVGDRNTHLLPVIATDSFGINYLGGVINSFLLYSCFSAANSALFIASRTLYGLGSSIQRDEKSRFLRWVSTLGNVDRNGVPSRAILGSMIFAWMPFLSLANAYGTDSMEDILQSIGTTSCVLVWASQALAFLRYHWWLRSHHQYLVDNYKRFDRWSRKDRLSWLDWAQPWLAWFALITSVTIILVFASAGLWSSNPAAQKQLKVKALDQYLGPGLLLVMFIALKVVKRRWWVRLGDWDQLRDTLVDLDELVVSNVKETAAAQTSDMLMNDGTDPVELVQSNEYHT